MWAASGAARPVSIAIQHGSGKPACAACELRTPRARLGPYLGTGDPRKKEEREEREKRRKRKERKRREREERKEEGGVSS